ncbi:unnamed protein product [Lepeophtheirus salmonis]|uniref:(salmon louse) hypothetical protein n=1 Tax=Lepeophtheirus salmonis TaxID=72036 RepID=A0A817FA66_LEPSM|nr:unnamed protein product [Lepeophtheirus salmonis]CAG9474900.1 unnamed protein product [Lepeophtheirus salmonis]
MNGDLVTLLIDLGTNVSILLTSRAPTSPSSKVTCHTTAYGGNKIYGRIAFPIVMNGSDQGPFEFLITDTQSEHLSTLCKVYESIRVAGARLNKNKCVFAGPELTYLEFKVMEQGCSLEPELVRPLIDLPTTNSAVEESFISIKKAVRSQGSYALRSVSVREISTRLTTSPENKSCVRRGNLTARLAHFAVKLSMFNFQIKQLKGSEISHTDVFSHGSFDEPPSIEDRVVMVMYNMLTASGSYELLFSYRSTPLNGGRTPAELLLTHPIRTRLDGFIASHAPPLLKPASSSPIVKDRGYSKGMNVWRKSYRKRDDKWGPGDPNEQDC